ncbi:hypothetical protein Ahy_B10g100849 [Arachis hypogaea]|uniref:Uncharacterized protein n=1 Tax=Arachis hypogaea TaxID=3818 RepID=A0A444WXX2_ARAHY|nr:hypothetical protein Ahy_B10g100849 [Arachis hypogaea]
MLYPLLQVFLQSHVYIVLVHSFYVCGLSEKLEIRDFFLVYQSYWFVEKMIDASPFPSLDHATSFSRQLWFKESRIQLWLDAFSRHRHLTQAIGHALASMMKELFQWDRRYTTKFRFEFTTSTDTHAMKILLSLNWILQHERNLNL